MRLIMNLIVKLNIFYIYEFINSWIGIFFFTFINLIRDWECFYVHKMLSMCQV